MQHHLRVALAPCGIGYATIGAWLAADPATRAEGNPYAAWIEMYAGDEFQAGARAEGAILDEYQSLANDEDSSAAFRYLAGMILEVGIPQLIAGPDDERGSQLAGTAPGAPLAVTSGGRTEPGPDRRRPQQSGCAYRSGSNHINIDIGDSLPKIATLSTTVA